MLFRSAINSIDNEIIDSAKNLGSSQLEILFKVVLPIVKPTLITLIIITFQTGLASFAAPLMVGGKDFQTISPLILTFSQRPKSRDIASVLSLVLASFQIVLLAIMKTDTRKNVNARYDFETIQKHIDIMETKVLTDVVCKQVANMIALNVYS